MIDRKKASPESGNAVGDGIIAPRSSWRFDGAVPERFDRHVSRSIPGYDDGHELVIQHSRDSLGHPGITYELGCSTGVLTEKLANASHPEGSRIIGIDQVEGMLGKARQRCKEHNNVFFERGDVVDYSYLPAALMVSYYTLQFIPVALRQGVVDRIARALQPEGAFILFEKICFSDPEKDREVTRKYYAYKRSRGYSDEEILSKAASLEGVLVPRTEQENRNMLKQSGFGHVETIFSELCWQGYVARLPC
jgi:tRNA (cmo5U34)-methyltransferase